jgi:hypothetical protein
MRWLKGFMKNKQDAIDRREIIKHGFRALKRGSHTAFGALGEALTSAVKNKDYDVLGYKTAEQYFQHEIGECKTTCHNMMDYYEVIVPLLPKYDLEQFPVSAITQNVIPLLRKGTPIDKIIPLIQDTPRDRKQRFRQLEGKTPAWECNHEDCVTLKKCNQCGEIIK